jgi:hypothetical protein
MKMKRKKPPVIKNDIENSWVKNYWRPAIAWQYFAVCVFDFILAPTVMLLFSYKTGMNVQWAPLTLKESGFYHMAMGAILGVAAWTRGQEKITRITNNNDEDDSNKSVVVEKDTASQTPTGK